MDLGCQNEPKLNPKWDQKSMLTSKGDFSKNLIFPKEKQRFLRSNRSKLGAKMDQKSIKKESAKYNAPRHRFLSDFSGFLGVKLGPSWRQVGLENRWQVNPKRLGRFHISLGTFQEAPERETLIFHWFWKVFWGGSTHAPWRGCYSFLEHVHVRVVSYIVAILTQAV